MPILSKETDLAYRVNMIRIYVDAYYREQAKGSDMATYLRRMHELLVHEQRFVDCEGCAGGAHMEVLKAMMEQIALRRPQ